MRRAITIPSIMAFTRNCERRIGKSSVASQPLVLSGEVSGAAELAGYVEVEVDDGLKRQEFEKDRRAYLVIFLAQFVLSLGFILLLLHLRVLRPLAGLTQFSNQLASGDFDHPIGVYRADEIGRLAQHMDQMRGDLKTSFAEQRVILSNVQVGVILFAG